MKPEAHKYLYDIRRAAELLTEFTAGKTLADYQRDAMLRAAVERQFEVIGEATARLAKVDPGARRPHRRLPSHRGLSQHPDPRLCRGGRPFGVGCSRSQAPKPAPGCGRAVEGGGERTALIEVSLRNGICAG